MKKPIMALILLALLFASCSKKQDSSLNILVEGGGLRGGIRNRFEGPHRSLFRPADSLRARRRVPDFLGQRSENPQLRPFRFFSKWGDKWGGNTLLSGGFFRFFRGNPEASPFQRHQLFRALHRRRPDGPLIFRLPGSAEAHCKLLLCSPGLGIAQQGGAMGLEGLELRLPELLR